MIRVWKIKQALNIGDVEDEGKELFVADVNPTIHVSVVSSESAGESLQLDAELNEIIECDMAFGFAIIASHQDSIELVRETIAESGESLFQFIEINVARIIAIERAKTIEPVGDVTPEIAKLLKIDGPRMVTIKHADHETHLRRGISLHLLAIGMGLPSLD